jgi:hypothetical protein
MSACAARSAISIPIWWRDLAHPSVRWILIHEIAAPADARPRVEDAAGWIVCPALPVLRRQIMYDLLVLSVWSRVILDFFAHLRGGRGRAHS